MNLYKLKWSAWIIVLNIILLIILFIQITLKKKDTFINYPEQVNPDAPIISDSASNTANNNYASLLLFIQQNPDKSIKFIEDIKNKFFDNNCKVKNNIDFQNLAQFGNGMPFSS